MKLARMLFDLVRSKLFVKRKRLAINNHNLLNVSEQIIGDTSETCHKSKNVSVSGDPDLLLVEDDYLIKAFDQVYREKKQ